MMTTHEPLTFQDGLDPVKQLERFCQELREGDAFLAVEIEQSAMLVRFDQEALVLAAYTPTKDTLHNNKDLLQMRLSAYAPGCKLRILGRLTDVEIAARDQATNKIPWTCYRNHNPRFEDDFVIPRDLYVCTFVDRRGRTLEFTRITGWEKFHEYVLASMIGEWILTGRRVLDFNNLSTRVRIKNLCHKINVDGLEQAIHERNKDGPFAHFFIRAYTEYQYQTLPISLITARNLRFYETHTDMFDKSYEDFEVHHILPKCEFEEYETDLRNLVKIPKPIHQLLHDVYKDINNGWEPGCAFIAHWNIDSNYKFEHETVIPDGFFESRCEKWFGERVDAEDIYRDLFEALYSDRENKLKFKTPNHFVYVRENDYDGSTRLIAKQIYFRSPPPPYWTQHWATVANMCAYLYAAALHRRLA